MDLKQKSTKFIFLIFAFIFIVVYALTSNFLQLKSYNILSKFAINNKQSSDKIVLVVIDDKSLQEIGRWPWKREYYLEIFDYFENHTKAKLMGYDGLVVAPDLEHPKSDKKFFSKIGDFKKLTAAVAFFENEFEKNIDETKYDKLLQEKTVVNIMTQY